MSEYGTMKDIGSGYGLTSHGVGKLLKKHGLRTDDGRPSAKAFEIGMVEQKGDGLGHYLWAWHSRKVQMLLERLGHVRQNGKSVS